MDGLIDRMAKIFNRQQFHVADNGSRVVFVLVQAKSFGATPTAKQPFHVKGFLMFVVMPRQRAWHGVEGQAAMPAVGVAFLGPFLDLHGVAKQGKLRFLQQPGHVPVGTPAIYIRQHMGHARVGVGMVHVDVGARVLAQRCNRHFFYVPGKRKTTK